MARPVDAGLLEIVESLLPGAPLERARLAVQGNMHHVVLLPGIAAVRVTKRASAAAELSRRVDILRYVADAGLPFAVPLPLTPVTMYGGQAAVALSWIDGAGLPEGTGDPEIFASLLNALRSAEVSPQLRSVLRTPRPYADGVGWADILTADVIPRLPAERRGGVRARLDDVVALGEVPVALVHGDLGAGNVMFDAEGRLTGVLDWDMCVLSDPAIDAALAATWHGWQVLDGIDEQTVHRARAWNAVVGIEHMHALFTGKPLASIDGFVDSVTAWLAESDLS